MEMLSSCLLRVIRVEFKANFDYELHGQENRPLLGARTRMKGVESQDDREWGSSGRQDEEVF